VIGASLRAALRRARGASGAALQTAAAAGIAWYLAHDALGHPQPFFAPIAAAVSLSISHVQRARRSVQMIVGVLLGIGVSEALRPLIGNSTASVAAVVLVTLLIAVAVGVGFVGEGMMFVNQAAASAILVVALHRAGTGSERAIDALVGGGVALAIGVGLFPAEPLKLLWRAEDGVLRALRSVLRREPLPRRSGADADMDWPLAASHEVHRRLTALTQARSTARASVRIAPRRMHLRDRVEAEERRVAVMYLLTGGALSLVRAIDDGERQSGGVAASAQAEVSELAAAVQALLAAPRPWAALALVGVRGHVEVLLAAPPPAGSPQDIAVSTAARRAARDLLALIGDGTPA
jgi:uncharacterized membrane protein YgaE (UPF0421/DUF939 family)